MGRVIRFLALSLVALAVLAIGSPVMAAPQGTASFAVTPVIGGPNAATSHDTPAEVVIPLNNPAINATGELMPGQVFVPVEPLPSD